MRGLPIKYSDKFFLHLFRLFIYSCAKKISNYQSVHVFNCKQKFLSKNQILHLDDPNYDQIELINLIKWEYSCVSKGSFPIIICTNSYTSRWLTANLINTKVFIVQQGFHYIELSNGDQHSNFSCVYTSPYIHYGKDKHAKHSTWGSKMLIEEIIPRLNSLDSEILIQLVGEVGNNAKKELKKFKNVYMHGRVNFKENIEILSRCSIGIYPRQYDHKRSILKIFSYIGAGLPIVTFDLIDTEVVKVNSLGSAVGSIDEFIASIIELKNSPDLMQEYKERISTFRVNFTWSILADKMERILSTV